MKALLMFGKYSLSNAQLGIYYENYNKIYTLDYKINNSGIIIIYYLDKFSIGFYDEEILLLDTIEL